MSSSANVAAGQAHSHGRSFPVVANLAVVEVEAEYLDGLGQDAGGAGVIPEPEAPVDGGADYPALSHGQCTAQLHEGAVNLRKGCLEVQAARMIELALTLNRILSHRVNVGKPAIQFRVFRHIGDWMTEPLIVPLPNRAHTVTL
jgi:hypothetical protein